MIGCKEDATDYDRLLVPGSAELSIRREIIEGKRIVKSVRKDGT